ncbi:MAG: helix-turn-helix transcriptional regulator, partial [Spirochaetaceae bacterium]|nr:helix-turn-helix transcriptional regulator [Spirochaetaceae bacterium]
MDRKAEIINATLELASEYGLATVSMNQIAEKLGITKPALYKHFASREEIIKSMYSFLRGQAKQNINVSEINYDMLSEEISLEKILTQMVES